MTTSASRVKKILRSHFAGDALLSDALYNGHSGYGLITHHARPDTYTDFAIIYRRRRRKAYHQSKAALLQRHYRSIASKRSATTADA